MKALILSDIHSNIDALRAIWAQESDSDQIFCAGDLVDYGLYPKEVIAWIQEHDVVCVQGNHDRRVAACYRETPNLRGIAPMEREWRHHNAQLLDEDDIRYLEQLPMAVSFELDGIWYGMTHLYQDYDIMTHLGAFYAFRDRLFGESGKGPVPRLVLGHTHRRAVHYLSDTEVWLNPGSASYRRLDDLDQSAHYITITDGVISLKHVLYDQTALYRQIEELPLKEWERRSILWAFDKDPARTTMSSERS